MTTTVKVTCRAVDQGGNPVSGAVWEAKLSTTEQNSGFVSPEVVRATSDAAGVAELNLWPNALGVASSSYTIKAINPDTGKRFINVTAYVPNSDCYLDQILVQEPFPTVSASQTALTEVQAATATVTTLRDEVSTLYGQTNTAKVAAQSAQTAAETAQTGAQTAKTAAETAQGLADSARIAAQSAQLGAGTAQGLAEDARDAALAAQTAAENAAGLVTPSLSAINTVATNAASVISVAGSIAAVNAVAVDLESPSSAVEALGPVAGDLATLGPIAQAIQNVSAVAVDVVAVSGIHADVTTVATNIGAVQNVSSVSGAVSTVSGISGAVSTVASNIVSVQNASANAASAAASATSAGTSATSAAASAAAAATSASQANTSAGAAAGSASSALSIYGSASAQQAAVSTAQAQASLAAGYAASASSVVQQDLSGVTAAALHRSPNAVTAMFVYNTQLDSDGGAWTERCQHTSWYNETLNGKWLGAQTSETYARYEGATLGTDVTNGGFDTDTAWTKNGWAISGGTASYAGGAGAAIEQASPVTLAVGDLVKVTVTISAISSGYVYAWVAGGVTSALGISATRTNASGTYTWYFPIATVTNQNVGIYCGSSPTGIVIDNVSIRKVTATTTASGDYFQLTTDGKFYSLNKNLLTTTATLSTQTQWLTAGTYTLSSTTASSGSVAVSGAATASHTAGGAATTFTVAASGNVTFTVTGSVTTAQCELGSLATTYQANASTTRYTETFRGNKASFPKLAAIVADAGPRLSIYDLTEPGRPMWMSFIADYNSGGVLVDWYNRVLQAIRALNGTVFIGSTYAVSKVSFAKDIIYRHTRADTGNSYSWQYISGRNNQTLNKTSIANIASTQDVSDISVCVMPGASVDAVTGLPEPTAAAVSTYNTYLFHSDGRILMSVDHTGGNGIYLTPKVLMKSDAGPTLGYTGFSYILNPGSATSLSYTRVTGTEFNRGNTSRLLGSSRNKLLRASASLIQCRLNNEKFDTKSLNATITNTYNTGHQLGDIKRTYLSDVDAGSVVGTELVTNGTFDTDNDGWTLTGGTFSVSGGVLTLTNTAGRAINTQSIATRVGATYKITSAGLANGSGGAVAQIRINKSANDFGSASVCFQNANGTLFFIASAVTTYLYIADGAAAGAGATISIDSVSVQEAVADRSYKSSGATIYGTLTKTAVATSAQLVAYSGFSAANYLREPYSADLDFGTGEWSVGAWCNVPVSLPAGSFPNSGTNLISNGTFESSVLPWSSSSDTLAVDYSIFVDGGLKITKGAANTATLQTVSGLTIGKTYRLTAKAYTPSSNGTARAACLSVNELHNATAISVTANDVIQTLTTPAFVATATTLTARLSVLNQGVSWGYTNDVAYFDDVTFYEVNPALVADRAYSSGPKINFGVTALGYLTATASDGTTTRTVTTTAAYNTATWLHANAVYRKDGSLAILVNGQQVQVTYGNPLLTLNNSNAELTIGNSYALDAPFPGSIALLKLSATAPTPDQAVWMYEQEKQLFRDGAQCVLPDANAIQDLTYDEATDKWVAVSTTNESQWSGLVRTGVTAVPAGTYSKVTAGGGVKLSARITTTPGVDVTIPAYGLRSELVKRAEAVARINQDIVTFDYVGGFTATTVNGNTAITSVAGLSYPAQTSIVGAVVTGSGIPASTTVVAVSGTTIYLSAAATAGASNVQISFTDFVLPVGYEAKAVMSAGALKQEGSTKDWTRLFDGFRETVRFAAAPGYTAWVQIQAVKAAA